MKNEIQLDTGLDPNLRPLKVGGEVSSLEIATKENGAKVTGNLNCTGDIVTKYLSSETIITFQGEHSNSVTAGTVAIDWNIGQKQNLSITGTGNTINFTNPLGICNLTLRVIQTLGIGVVGTWDSDIKWAGGSAPTLSTGNGEIDIISFYFDGTNYFGVASLDFG